MGDACVAPTNWRVGKSALRYFQFKIQSVPIRGIRGSFSIKITITIKITIISFVPLSSLCGLCVLCGELF